MPVRTANAVWNGDLPSGSGTVSVQSGALDGARYSAASRFEEGTGTNPDELLGAAHAGCFAMALANALATAGHAPTRVATDAQVHLSMEGGPHVAKIVLTCDAEVPGLNDATFQEYAEATKVGCPISKSLAVEIELHATLR
ncbi:MAG: OsmC family peroxiredoxin [Trueperaceae bacterium]